MYLVKK